MMASVWHLGLLSLVNPKTLTKTFTGTYRMWRYIDMYDHGPKLGMRCKRNCAEDSATVKGKRPDFFLLSSRALLFKGEDKTSEAELEKALEKLSIKLKEWGAAVHGNVLQLNPPYCQATSHAQCCMDLLCRSCACKIPRML